MQITLSVFTSTDQQTFCFEFREETWLKRPSMCSLLSLHYFLILFIFTRVNDFTARPEQQGEFANADLII